MQNQDLWPITAEERREIVDKTFALATGDDAPIAIRAIRLLIALANDETVDDESATETIESLNKSQAEMESDVAVMRQRLERRRLYERGPNAKKRLDKLRAEVKAKTDAFNELASQHDESMATLFAESLELGAAADAAATSVA